MMNQDKGKNRTRLAPGKTDSPPSLNGNHVLKALLQKLYRERGMDFREYKKTSLRRRIQKRIDETGAHDYSEYMKVLDRDPDEYAKLFDALLINVTSFFRDPEAFDTLEKEVIPEIMARKKKGDTIRVWSAGCASGEEAYSVAILLSEAVKDRAREVDLRIYATDIDEKALMEARRGVYDDEKIKNVKEDFLTKYFTREDGKYRVSRNVRQAIIFGVHNLTRDAPISHLDLIVCRNVLIYFDVPLQNKVLMRFHYALQPSGYVFFGKSDSMLLGSDIYRAVNKKWRIFLKVPEIMVELTKNEDKRARKEETLIAQAIEEARGDIKAIDLYFQSIVQNIGLAVLAVDKDGIVTMVNRVWEELWNVKAEETVGHGFYEQGPLQQIPGVERWLMLAMKERKATRNEESEIKDEKGGKKFVQLSFVPMVDPRGNTRGVIIIAEDTTESKKMLEDFKRYNEELQSLNEKLETTNEELVSSNEELETTSEELQSTAEELQTNNEELQSANEEMEATNEELTSANEELETMNDELRSKTELLDSLDMYRKFLLENASEGVIELDVNGNIKGFNSRAEEIWEVKSEKALGKNLLLFDSDEEMVTKLRKKMREAIEKRKMLVDNTNFTAPSGKKRKLRIKIVPVIEGAEVLGSLLLAGDISGKQNNRH